ncbi:hypothetical protein [uncultured Holdemanella sp.]|uniref:hypothetical protein n=1 Tax=uncultured Holdemanella sp. TaxID=1763549 RepID=UPI0025F23C2B|nr:hypothetical protein [uncultured Holdemanella sp.]
MKKKKNDKFAVACAFEILHECISIDHIEDCNEICKSLESYDELSKECLKSNDLSDEFLKDVQRYIDNYILPILEEDYWDFIKKEEYGKVNDKGFFEINSEESAEKICLEFMGNSLNLAKELLNVFSKYLR